MAYMVSYTKRRLLAIVVLLIVCGTVLLEVFAIGIATVISLNLQEHHGVIRSYDSVLVPVLMEIMSVLHFLVAAYEVEGWLLYRRRLIKEVCDVTKRLQIQLYCSYVVTALIGIAFLSIAYGLFTASTTLQFNLKKYMRHYRTNVRMKDKLDQLQIVFGCCGNRSFKDWFKLPWINRHYRKYIPATYDRRNRGDNAPFSCCNPAANRQCIHYGVLTKRLHYNYEPLRDLTLYQPGCDQVVTLYLKEMYMSFLGHLLIVLLFKITDICVSRLIYTSHIKACQSGDPQATTPGYICRKPRDEPSGDDSEDKAPSSESLKEKESLEATVSVSSCVVIPNEVKVRPCPSPPIQPPPPYPWPDAPEPIKVEDDVARTIQRSRSQTVSRTLSQTICRDVPQATSQIISQSVPQLVSEASFQSVPSQTNARFVPRTVLHTGSNTQEYSKENPKGECQQTDSTNQYYYEERVHSFPQDISPSNNGHLEQVCFHQRNTPNNEDIVLEMHTTGVQTTDRELPTDAPCQQIKPSSQSNFASRQHVCAYVSQDHQCVAPAVQKLHTCRTALQQELDSEIHRFARKPPFIGDPDNDVANVEEGQYPLPQLHVCPNLEYTDCQTSTGQANAIPCVLYRSESSDIILCTQCSTMSSGFLQQRNQTMTHSCPTYGNNIPPPPPPPPPPTPSFPWQRSYTATHSASHDFNNGSDA